MRLFRLTFATIFQRKAWAICAFAVTALPFALPMISSATEKPLLVQPARILAAWGMLWTSTPSPPVGHLSTNSSALSASTPQPNR